MSQGIRAASVNELVEGEALLIDSETAGTNDGIALFRDDDGTFYALDDTCSHELASLAAGFVEDGTVECPLHAAQFCLKTGAALCLPATKPVRTHRVEIVGEDVWVYPGQVPSGQ